MLPTKWPQWIIIPIGFLLVAVITGAGLGTVVAVQAIAPSPEMPPSPTSTQEGSMQDPDLLAYAHAQEGLACLDCHRWESRQVPEEPVAEEAVAQRMTAMDFCVDCHVDNEHTSYDQVIERTTDYMIDGQNINPHDAHAETMEVEEIACYTCHRMHGESPLINGCYSCHHDGTFKNCSGSGCH
jgi:hypothetical protein